jgi:hypothetical protein
MSNIDPSEAFWLKFWLIVATTIVLTAWAIAWFHVSKLSAYVEGGYQEEYVPGNADPIWVKSERVKQ